MECYGEPSDRRHRPQLLPWGRLASFRIIKASGIGSALMEALLAAADAAGVLPLIVLLGSPQYYSRFGFRPAKELGVIPPEPNGEMPPKPDL